MVTPQHSTLLLSPEDFASAPQNDIINNTYDDTHIIQHSSSCSISQNVIRNMLQEDPNDIMQDDAVTLEIAEVEVPLLHLSNQAQVQERMDTSDPYPHSCMSSAATTPLPVKKFKPTESDAGTDLWPICRICQLPGDKEDYLFSPCRCSGTMMFVHYFCLLKWIEVSTRNKAGKPPQCELCHFEYIRHKRFKLTHWQWPHVSSKDKCLHAAFFVNLIVMVSCAVATILCFLSDKDKLEESIVSRDSDGKSQMELNVEEIITLSCGVLFFVSFFIAMTVEIKARHTIYRLFHKFLAHNTEWQIEPYQPTRDLELIGTLKPV